MREPPARRGLAATLATGMKDIPRNASWVIGKALSQHEATDSAMRRIPLWRRRPPGRLVAPGRVARTGLRRGAAGEGRIAAKRARPKGSSLRAAQTAHDRSVEADEMAEAERARLKGIEAGRLQGRATPRRGPSPGRGDDRREAARRPGRRRQRARGGGGVSEDRIASGRRSAESAQQDAEERFEPGHRPARRGPGACRRGCSRGERGRRAGPAAGRAGRGRRTPRRKAATRRSPGPSLRAYTATTAKTVMRGVSDKQNPSASRNSTRPAAELAAARASKAGHRKTKQQPSPHSRRRPALPGGLSACRSSKTLPWRRPATPVSRLYGRRLAVSGVSAAVALLAASAASAAATAARRRGDQQ